MASEGLDSVTLDPTGLPWKPACDSALGSTDETKDVAPERAGTQGCPLSLDSSVSNTSPIELLLKSP